MFYNKAKKQAIKLLEDKQAEYKDLGNQANDYTLKLFNVRKSAVLAIERVEEYVNILANTPKEFAKQIAEVKISIKDFNEAIKIEKENASNNIKGASAAITGTAAGGGFFASYKNKKAAEQANKAAMEISNYIYKLRPKLTQLIHLHEKTDQLKSGLNIAMMVNTYPKDYLLFNDEQKKKLSTVINNVRAMGELINQRIN